MRRRQIRILDTARRDLEAGFRFYEAQADGIGRYFLDTLYSDIESLRINAGIHAVCFGDYHRLLSKRFPWAVYYKIKNGGVRIHAILDTRRHPNRANDRLERA